jgi:hypothetical protein
MKLRELLQRARKSLSRRHSADHATELAFRPRCYRPALEVLEQRCLLSTLGDGLNLLLTNPGTGLQAGVNADIYSVNMPILGAGLSTASQYTDTQFLQTLGGEFKTLLQSLPANYTATDVENAINNAPNSPGSVSEVPNPAAGGTEFQITLNQSLQPLASSETFAFHSGLFLDSSPSSSIPAPLVLSGAPTPVHVSLGYNFVFDFGQDGSGNVYLNASSSTLQVTVEADLKNFVGSGTLMGVPVQVADGSVATSIGLPPPQGSQAGSVFQGAFTLQINGGSGSVYATDIQNNQVNLAANSPVKFQPDQATYGGNAYINLGLVISPAGNDFPGIGGNLQIVWPLTANTVQNLQLPSGDSSGKPGTTPTVAFNDVGISGLQTFLNQFLEPIIQPLQQFLSPIAPILDFLNNPIPVLDAVISVTPLEMLEDVGGVGDPTFLNDLISLAGNLASGHLPTLPSTIISALDFGSFTLPAGDDLRTVSLGTEIGDFAQPADNQVSSDVLTAAQDLENAITGFFPGNMSLPFLEQATAPQLLLDALLGQPVTLFTYTLPQINVSIDVNIPDLSNPGFQIYPPYPVFLTVTPHLDFSAALSFGYDTVGLQDGHPIDGLFFFNPTNGPQTGIHLGATIDADASINLGLLAAGAGGGIQGGLNMFLDSTPTDPAGDIFYDPAPLGTKATTIVSFADIERLTKTHSLLGLFAPSGPADDGHLDADIGVNFNVFFQIGEPPLGFRFSKDFGNLTLFNFNFDPWTKMDATPTLATYVDPSSGTPEASTTTTPQNSTVPIATPQISSNTTLRLNFGEFMGDANIDHPAPVTSEDLTIAPVFDATGAVEPNDVLVTEFGITQEYDNVKTIQAWGAVNPSGQLADNITVEQGVTADVDFYGASRATPQPLEPLTNTYKYDGSGTATMHGGNWATNYLYGGSGINKLYGSAIGNNGNGMPPADPVAVDNYLFGGNGVNSTHPAQNFLYGYDPSLVAPGQQQGSSVEMMGGGPNSTNQMTAGGAANVFSQSGGTFEYPTTNYLVAGAGSNAMIGGSGFNYYQWTEGDGSLTVTGGVPAATQLADGQPFTDTNQLEILGGAAGSEQWSVQPAQTTALQILGTDLTNGQSIGTPIDASDIQVLSIDTAVGALVVGHSGTEQVNPGNNTFIVGDLSETGIQQVLLNAHESQGSPDAAPDTIIINGSQIPASADKVAISDENFQDGNSQELELEDVSLTTILGASGGHIFGLPQPAPYHVAAAITNPLDSLTVNTYQGNDQVNVLSTTGPGSTHINTGAGSGPGGNNQFVVGNGAGDILPNFLDDIQGALFIDAGNGTGNSLLFSDSATTDPDTLVLTSDSLVRYAALSSVSREGDFPAHKRYPFVISYTATGGAFGAGIELDTTLGSDTIYVPSTPRGTSVTIDTGTSDGAAVSNPPPGPNPPHDQVFVGFDGVNPNGPPNPESLSTLAGILSPVNVVGEGFASSLDSQTDLTIADEAASTTVNYTLNTTELQSDDSASINFNQSPSGVLLTNLVLMAGANAHVAVLGASTAATTTVDAGPGNNTILVSDAGSLAPLRGLLVVNGGAGTNLLTVDDSADTATQSFNLGVTTGASGKVTGGTLSASYSVPAMTFGGIAQRYPIGIEYSAISTLNVLAGAGGISFVVQGTPGLTAVNLSAVGTGNSLTGPNADVTWQFAQAGDSFSQGSLFGTVSFSGIQAIQGGSGNDDFLFMPGGFASSIDGGAGADTLDFSQYGNVSGQGVELAQDGTLDGVQGVANFGLPEFNDIDALVGSPGSFLTGTGKSGAFYSGSFNQTLSVSGFASMRLAVQGNFNGKLLAATEGTADDPITLISVEGLMGSAGLIKVGFLQNFMVSGSMLGTLKGFGVDPSTPTIQSITIAGDFLAPGQIIAPTVGQLLFQHDFGGIYDETSPTGDFQTLEIDGHFLASGLIEAASGGLMTVFGNFMGKAIIAGALNSIVVDGAMNGVLSAGSIGTQFLSGLVTGHIYMGLITAPPVNVAPGDTEGLIQAIDEANELNLPSVINLAAGSTYLLTAPDNYWYGPNGLPAIANNITINGDGAVLARVGSAPFRIFNVSGGLDTLPAGQLNLENLTVEGGLAQGGAGGAGYEGGGGGAGLGGAIFNEGTLDLVGVTLTQNIAQGGDGGDFQFGSQTDGFGGGLANTPSLGSFGGGGAGGLLSNDGGFGGGGGGRHTGGFGGGSGSSSGLGGAGGGGAGLGGAIFNMFGSVTITNSTLAINSAVGGAGAQGGSGLGGAIFNLDGTATLVNDTLAGNHVVAGNGNSADGDDLYNLALAPSVVGIGSSTSATVRLTSDILAGTTPAKTGGANDVVNSGASASVLAVGPNLIQQVASGTVSGNGAIINGDPLLGPLQNNGGPTPTMEVLAGSQLLLPAHDQPTNGTPSTDQRGVVRGSTFNVLGAYQATTAAQLIMSGFPTLVTATVPQKFTVIAEDMFGKTVYTYAGKVSIISTDPKATLPPAALLTPGAGAGSFTATLNTPGIQAVIASDGVINMPGTSQPEVFVSVMPGFGTQTQLKIVTKNPVYGQPVEVDIHVQATTAGAMMPMGTVNLMDGTTQLLMSALDASGNASLKATLPAGGNALTATYVPGATFTGSSATAAVVVGMASTQVALAASPNPAIVGQMVALTAMVSAKAPGAGMPTGRVQFKDGSTVIGTADLDSSGMATMQTTKLTAGTHAITASYGGDGNFMTSTAALSETVASGYSLIVTNAADPATLVSGTLRAAVFQANTDAARGVFDTITFNTVKMGTSTIMLSQGMLELSGEGTGPETINGGATPITIDANHASKIFLVDPGVHEVLDDLIVTNAMSPGGGDSNDAEDGAGINNNGVLTLTDCTFSHDTAVNDGGAINNSGPLTMTGCFFSADSAGGNGGAIENHATLTVIASTFIGCYAVDGAAIDNRGTTATVTNCTFANNGRSSLGAESDQGGALWNVGAMMLTYDTISANAAHTGGGVYTYPGIGSLTALDTIVAANSATSGPDIAGALQNPSHNLLGTALEGIAAGAGDVFSDQPMLAAVAIYGGIHQTMPPLPGSPALDGASKNPATTADENGVTRPLTAPDIGAFQTLGFTMTVVAGTTPQSTAVGSAFGNPLAVKVTAKSLNDPVIGGVVVFAGSAGTGGASGTFAGGQTTLSVNIDGAMAATPVLTANSTVGTFTVTATAPGLTGGPVIFTLNNTPAAASIKFVNVVMDHAVKTTTTVGMAFGSPSPTVEAFDATGKPVSGFTVLFTLPSSGPSAMAAASLSVVTGATGLASAPALTANTIAGSWLLDASLGAMAATPQTMTNNPGAFTQLVYQSGAGQAGTVSTAFTSPLIAEAEDRYGNGVNGIAVTFSAPANPLTHPGPSATLSATTAKTTTTTVTVPSATINGQAGLAVIYATANSVVGGPYNVVTSASLPSGTKTTMSGGTFTLTNGNVLASAAIREVPNFGADAPQDIAASDSNLAVTDQGHNPIVRLTTAGVMTRFTIGIAASSGLEGITAVPDDTIGFAAAGIGGVGFISG